MKKLNDFVPVYEYRRKKVDTDATPAQDVNMNDLQDQVTQGGKKIDAAQVDKVKPGKSEEDNGTGLYAVDPPTPEDEAEWEQMDPDKQSDNANELANAFQTEENFIVLGEAGWAKTQLIMKMAHRAGRHVITVFLDKAVATDLGGIPVPTKDEKTGAEYAKFLLPSWAMKMLQMTHDDPKIKFLLFFDELNQAQPDVLNALMPIVLKHEVCGVTFDNVIVGAAGNLASENSSLTDIESHKPLMSRFPSKIYWETHTDPTWKEHFEWAHKKWDAKIGKGVIDECAKLKDYWASPRDLTLGVYTWILNNKGKKVFLKPAKLVERLEKSVIWKDMDDSVKNSRKFTDDINKFAQYLIDYANGNIKDASDSEVSKRRSKGADQINTIDKDTISNALINGYLYNTKAVSGEDADNKKYLCTLENVITELFNPEITGVTAEVLKKIVKDIEASGKSVRFKTDADGKAEAEKRGWIIPKGL